MARPEAAQGKPGYLDLTVLLLGVGLSQTAPRDFGIGEHDRRNGIRLERDFVSGDSLDGDAAFVHGLVSKHGFTDDIANRIDAGIIGLQLLVYLDEATRADMHAGLFEAGDF
jgi:hypothetical protein